MKASLDNLFYQVAAMLDIFRSQLTLQDVLTTELPLLMDLYNGRAKFLEEKRKVEEKEMSKMKTNRK